MTSDTPSDLTSNISSELPIINKQEKKDKIIKDKTETETNYSVAESGDGDFEEVMAEEVLLDTDPQKDKIKVEPPKKVAQKEAPHKHSIVHQIKLEVEQRSEGYYWQAKDGKAAKSLVAQIQHRFQTKHNRKATDEEVFASAVWVFDHLPDFYRTKFDISVISSKLNAIMEEIKSSKNGTTNTNSVIDRATSALEYARAARATMREAS